MRNALTALLLLVPVAVPAQQRQPGLEASVGGVAAFARRTFAGGALGLAWRGGGQGRAAVTVAGGVLGSDPGARLEASAQFLVNPAARSGATLYGALGAAYVVARGSPGAGYVLILVGAERAAGRGVGWFVEAGLGGGARVAVGVRARRPPRARG